MSSYSDKLRDPRWQKKRLEIMQRDNFTCVLCAEKEKTLNIHHCFYEYGNDPWDYPHSSLLTLCEDCHENEESMRGADSNLIRGMKRSGFVNTDFDHISYLFFMLEQKGMNARKIVSAVSYFIINLQKGMTQPTGGKTNSADCDKLPTGEGSSAGEAVERKDDAIA